MPNFGIIFLIAVFITYLLCELYNLAQKLKGKIMFPYLDEDFFDLNDIHVRDFSGDDDKSRLNTGNTAAGGIVLLNDSEFSLAQKKVLQLPILDKDKKPLVDVAKKLEDVSVIEKVVVEEKEEEDVEFEFRDVKAIKKPARKKAVKKNATKK